MLTRKRSGGIFPKVLLEKIPAVIFPPSWAVPVLAVITAIFGSTGNRQNRYRQRMKYREPTKTYRHIALLPKKYHKKRSTGNGRKRTAILQYSQKRMPGSVYFPPFLSFILRRSLYVLSCSFLGEPLFLICSDRRHLPTHTCCCPECVIQQNDDRCRW